MVIRMYLVKICKTACFEHNVQEFVVLYYLRFLDCYMQNLVKISEIAKEEFEKVHFSFSMILQMEVDCEYGRGLHHTIQVNSGNMSI